MDDIIIKPITFEEKNLWDLDLKYNYKFTNSIEEVINLIKRNEISIEFKIADKYIPGNKTNTYIDSYALKNNILIRYTDSNHNVAVSKIHPTYINQKFYKKYEKEIKTTFVEQLKFDNKKTYTISKNIFSDELFNVLIEKENVTLYFKDVSLSEKQIDILREKLINAYLEKDNKNIQISSKNAFDFYSKEKLSELDHLNIYFIDSLKNNNILNLKNLKDNAIIEISFYDDAISEEEKLSLIQEKLIKLNTLNKKFIVKINVEKRSIFNKLFKNLKLDNISLIIKNDLYEYSEEEYFKEDKKIENLVSNIKNSNLSPLEKFIAVYNIVKNIKPYKENEEKKEEARYLRYILDNDYIVCVGYARLLVELLDKIGINATDYSVCVDVSYDEGFTLEEKNVLLVGHARVIVNMDDDKYNIHGLYVSDPTWDNNQEKNLLNNSLLPFDSMQRDFRMFSYDIFNPILDIHNFDEYNKQINFLLKRKIEKFTNIFMKDNNFNEKLIETYRYTGDEILKTINCDPKYYYFMKKLSACKTEEHFIHFYTELGHYLLTRINKKFNSKKILDANQKVIETLNDNVVETTSKDDTEEYFYKRDIKQFPYSIPDNNDYSLEYKIK